MAAAVSSSSAVLLLVVVLTAAAAMVVTAAAPSSSSSNTAASGPDGGSGDTKPSILTPVAHTPLGSFEGADGPVADDAMDDNGAAPVGSPIGTTMTEPEPELAPPGPPGDDSGATAGVSVRGHFAAAAAVAAGAVVFAF